MSETSIDGILRVGQLRRLQVSLCNLFIRACSCTCSCSCSCTVCTVQYLHLFLYVDLGLLVHTQGNRRQMFSQVFSYMIQLNHNYYNQYSRGDLKPTNKRFLERIKETKPMKDEESLRVPPSTFTLSSHLHLCRVMSTCAEYVEYAIKLAYRICSLDPDLLSSPGGQVFLPSYVILLRFQVFHCFFYGFLFFILQ